ncbi:mannan endo-1,4-beta-mannosidase-like [Littorina saxatilis]|uniref:Mannan endo-1,4-beta-mannosidase n=1 Tax=Littorina saxatilis TaxID=31220 RepID=A0AAN9BDL4_9CAEN
MKGVICVAALFCVFVSTVKGQGFSSSLTASKIDSVRSVACPVCQPPAASTAQCPACHCECLRPACPSACPNAERYYADSNGCIKHTCAGRVTIEEKHLVQDGQRIFLSGANTAWVSYGYDFGNSQYQYRRNQFIQRLDLVKNAGGNSMRTWVHIHGATSPQFDSNSYVTGLDNDGTFLADFKQYLDDALARGILIFPTLWNGAFVKPQWTSRLQGLIKDTSKLQSYLDKALIPWVKAVKDHPALGGWDIINEMEGFIKPGQYNSESCFDTRFLQNSGAGWAGQLYTAQELLRFINWQAEAICRADPQALVTAGSWSQNSQTYQWGKKNLYSDQCLIKAGGKANGILTFYSTHSYAWQGQFGSEAVFNHQFSDYNLYKPLVVAEFSQTKGAGRSAAQLFNYVYDNGYSGAWIWSDETNAVQSAGISALNGKNGAGGLVNFPL